MRLTAFYSDDPYVHRAANIRASAVYQATRECPKCGTHDRRDIESPRKYDPIKKKWIGTISQKEHVGETHFTMCDWCEKINP